MVSAFDAHDAAPTAIKPTARMFFMITPFNREISSRTSIKSRDSARGFYPKTAEFSGRFSILQVRRACGEKANLAHINRQA